MSLLSLQAAQSSNQTVRDALGQAQTRINALALVHRMLNEVEDQTSVDLKRLLTELSRQVVDGAGSERPEFIMNLDLARVSAAGEVAVPVALFAVEALANVLKHAFPRPRGNSTVTVTLRRIDGGRVRLAIQDNGEGFAKSGTISGIGDRLLKVFGRQIHGTVEVTSEPGKGTIVELVFPAAESDRSEIDHDYLSVIERAAG
jgi:two-component sensor histidine kinase